MPIWLKRLAERVVIAAASCIEPITSARRVEFRNGTNAIAFVAIKKIAAVGGPGVGAFPGQEGLRGSDRGVDFSDAAWSETGTGPEHSRGVEYQPQHLKALAPMVAG